jgi:hypothetical protein
LSDTKIVRRWTAASESDVWEPELIDLFPDSTHVRTLGRSGASDTSFWDIARDGGFLLVTRDEDFVGMSVQGSWRRAEPTNAGERPAAVPRAHRRVGDATTSR